MIDLYYWTTPNGHKITIFLEEAEMPYRIRPVYISRGEQFAPRSLRSHPTTACRRSSTTRPPMAVSRWQCSSPARSCTTSPRDRAVSAVRCTRPRRGDAVAVLADGRPRPDAGPEPSFPPVRARKDSLRDRGYVNETERLYGVLDDRLAGRTFIAGDYSIADMAAYPWIVPHERQGINLREFPNLERWFETVGARPAVVRAYAGADEINTRPTVTEDARAVLFGQRRLRAAS